MRFNLNFPKKGIVGESICIKPTAFAKNITIPVKSVNSSLYLDLNLILSSIKPIKPEITTVKTKIKISLKKSGKNIVNNMAVIDIPMIIEIPPDSETSVFEALCISIPVYPFRFMIFIIYGIITNVITNPTMKDIIR